MEPRLEKCNIKCSYIPRVRPGGIPPPPLGIMKVLKIEGATKSLFFKSTINIMRIYFGAGKLFPPSPFLLALKGSLTDVHEG